MTGNHKYKHMFLKKEKGLKTYLLVDLFGFLSLDLDRFLSLLLERLLGDLDLFLSLSLFLSDEVCTFSSEIQPSNDVKCQQEVKQHTLN